MKSPASLLFSLLLLLVAHGARADAVVTACVMDGPAVPGTLAYALKAGGVIRFRCPRGTTIHVSGHYSLIGSTLIDGGDAVTLDGSGARGAFLFAARNTSTNTILRRIKLRGFSITDFGETLGSVLTAQGDAELDHVTIEGSENAIDISGTATVSDSTFIGDRREAIRSGTARVTRSVFTGNLIGLRMNAGWIRASTFSENLSNAVIVDPAAGPVEIRNSTFTSNRGGSALKLSSHANYTGPQTVKIRTNVFRENEGGNYAGAIAFFDVAEEARRFGHTAAEIARLAAYPPASFLFDYNQFTNNRGGRGGAIAADMQPNSSLISTGDLFVGNVAQMLGGGVVVSGGTMQVTHALFKANRAGQSGAALAVESTAQATLANSLVIANTAPRGAITGDMVRVANVTIADNGGAGLFLEGNRGRVANTIFAHNHPADCTGVTATAFQGNNLHSDGSCPSIPVGDAYLDTFYVPEAGSPALHSGDPKICAAAPVDGFDLPFQGRHRQAICALGAFEYAPIRKFTRASDRPEPHATADDDFLDDDGYRPPPRTADQGEHP